MSAAFPRALADPARARTSSRAGCRRVDEARSRCRWGPGLSAAATPETTASTLAGGRRPPRIVRTSAAERPALPRQGASMPPTGKAKPRKTTARKASTSRQTTAKKPAARPRVTVAARARFEQNGRAIARIKKALEVTEKELGAIRGSIRTGRRDLRKDVARLLRDARRDLEKMNKAVLRDLEQLQKDLSSHGGARPAGKPSSAAKRGASKRSSTAKRTASKRG